MWDLNNQFPGQVNQPVQLTDRPVVALDSLKKRNEWVSELAIELRTSVNHIVNSEVSGHELSESFLIGQESSHYACHDVVNIEVRINEDGFPELVLGLRAPRSYSCQYVIQHTTTRHTIRICRYYGHCLFHALQEIPKFVVKLNSRLLGPPVA
jgi:hypothetical protein